MRGCTPRSAASASCTGCPGFSRTIDCSHQVERRSRLLSLPRMSGSVPSGMATSNWRPTSVPKKSGGVTPTIVKGTRSTVIDLPMTFAAPPKRRCQKLYPITATGPSGPPPRRSSDGFSVRPSNADTPSTSKYEPLTHISSTKSGMPLSARLKREFDVASAPSKRSWWPRICSQTGLVQLVGPPLPTTTRRCGSVTGNDLSRRLSRSEKIAVFAPIPSASDKIATAVTTGVAFRARNASRRSCTNPPVRVTSHSTR
jgi:hypothetical protein